MFTAVQKRFTIEGYDRGQKFTYHRTIESLEEYVLVAQDRPQVDHFGRQLNGTRVLRSVTDMSDRVEFLALACSVPLSEIYAPVTLANE
jgi:Uma2 family endonuclease